MTAVQQVLAALAEHGVEATVLTEDEAQAILSEIRDE